MMKRIGLAIASLVLASGVARAEGYGAFAYDPMGAYGWSNDAPNEEDAKTRALAQCQKYSGGGKCEVITTFKNQCAAIADTRRSSGHVGWAASSRLVDAQQGALDSCNKKAGEFSCGVLAWTCPMPARP